MSQEQRADVSILVAGDGSLYVSGVVAVLGSGSFGFRIAGTRMSFGGLLQYAQEVSPDVVVLLDQYRDETNPILPLLEGLREREYSTVLVSSANDDVYHFAAMLAGASVIVPCSATPLELAEAIWRAAQRDLVVAPNLMGLMLERLRQHEGTGLPGRNGEHAKLTEQEVLMLRRLSKGATNKELSAAFSISLSTVKNRLNSIFGKLGVRSRSEAVAEGFRRHLV